MFSGWGFGLLGDVSGRQDDFLWGLRVILGVGVRDFGQLLYSFESRALEFTQRGLYTAGEPLAYPELPQKENSKTIL